MSNIINKNNVGTVAYYDLSYKGISKGIIVNQASATIYNTNNPSALNLTISKAINQIGLFFNGKNSRTSSTVNVGNVKTIQFTFRPQANTVDVIQLSGSGVITLNSSNKIATTGLTTPEIWVNNTKDGTVILNNWNVVTIRTNTPFAASAVIVGFSSTYFYGQLLNIRLSQLFIDYKTYNLKNIS
jgi:hypothetical protein